MLFLVRLTKEAILLANLAERKIFEWKILKIVKP